MSYFQDMENNQKPEWFELAENDQPVNRPRKNKKSAPMRNLTLILAGILVIPMGAGFALLTHDDNSAIAAETLNLTQDSPVATSSAQAQSSNALTMPTASRDDDDDEEEGDDDDYRAPVFSATSSKAPTVSTPAAPAATNPAPASKAPAAITPPGSSSASTDIILPPTKKAGDDDDDDDDDDDKKKSKSKKSKDSDDDDDEEDDD